MKRVKRRYLAIQIDCEVIPGEREFLDAAWAALTRLYGEVGASQSGLAMIYFDIAKKIAVVRVLLVCLPSLRASLSMITYISGVPVSLNVLAVSGTLKALHSKF